MLRPNFTTMTSFNRIFLLLGSVFLLNSCEYYPSAPMQNRPGYALNQRPRFGAGTPERNYSNYGRPRPQPQADGYGRRPRPTGSTTTTATRPKPRPTSRPDVSPEDWRPATNPTLEDSAPLPPASTGTTTSSSGSDVPYARTVPGKPGHVYVPDSDGREIDVTGLKSGSKAMDPDTKTVFRVP